MLASPLVAEVPVDDARPDAPRPAPADWSWGQFSPAAGFTVRYARVSTGGHRGVALLLHGRSDFIEKYAEVLEELAAQGFDAWTFDWRGQGRSTRLLGNPHKGHIDRFETYLADLDAFVSEVLEPAAGGTAQRVLVAHSMGAHLALRYLHDHPGRFDRAALVAPMIGIHAPVPPAAQRAITGLGARLGRGEAYAAGGDWGPRQQRFARNKRTRDRARFERVVAAVLADPALALGGPTLGWLAAAHASIATLTAPGFAAAIATPVLIAAGGADRIVDVRATLELAAALPSARTLVVPGARHELLHELDRARDAFWRAFEAFVADAPASGAAARGEVPSGADSV